MIQIFRQSIQGPAVSVIPWQINSNILNTSATMTCHQKIKYLLLELVLNYTGFVTNGVVYLAAATPCFFLLNDTSLEVAAVVCLR